MVIGIIPIAGLELKAEATSKTADEAISWCESLIDQKVGSGQCVALIQSYYTYLGVSPVSGHAYQYSTNALPSGWTRVYQGVPQKGDILVYTGAKYGHVAIYGGGTVSYHQNMAGKYVEKKTNWAYNKSWYSSAEGGTKSYWGYIRPDFSGSANFNANVEDAPYDWQTFDKSTTSSFTISGWAYRTTNELTRVYYSWDGGQYIECQSANRQDVVNAYGNTQLDCGFLATVDISSLSVGDHIFRIWCSSNGIDRDLWYIGVHIINSDAEKPVVTKASVAIMAENGYTAIAKASDNVGITKVVFPTWIPGATESEIQWLEGVYDPEYDHWACWIPVSNWNGHYGSYYTHVYAYDAAGNMSETYYSIDNIRVPKVHSAVDNLASSGTYDLSEQTTIFAKGWAYNRNGDEVKIHYRFDGEGNAWHQFDLVERADVVGANSECLQSKCGYNQNISIADLSAGQHVIDIIVETDGFSKVIASSTFTVVRQESYVYFDMNDGSDNNINLFAPQKASSTINGISYSYDGATGIMTLNGSSSSDIDISSKPFTTASGDVYKLSADYVSGSVSNGTLVLEARDNDGNRVNFDMQNFDNTKTWTITSSQAAAINRLNLWAWCNTDAGTLTFSNYKVKIKLEKVSSSSDPATDYTPNAKYLAYGQTYATMPVPEREGYTFNGWYTDKTGGTKIEASTVFKSSSAQTLYAQWTANEFALTYNANGGTDAPSSDSGDTSYTISSVVPERLGYTFLGWSKSSSATTSTYIPGDTITLTSDTTLYAVWKSATAISLYNPYSATVDFAYQEVYFHFTPTVSTRYLFGSVCNIDSIIYVYDTLGNQIAKDDDSGEERNFLLEVDLTAGTKYYVKINAYSTATGNIPFAVDTVSYSVSYDANGGTGAPSSQAKRHDISLTLSTTKPTRTGYTFTGWNTKADGTGTSYASGVSYTANASVTLYAQWAINTYAVKYDANGGSGAPSAQTKTYGKTLTLSSTKPTRTGYTFTGWNTAADGSGTSYAAGASYTQNAAVTLYAQWKINTFTVSFNANGGSGAPSAQTKTYGTALTLTKAVPSRIGYTFTSWNTKADGSGTSYAAGASYTANAAVTLYAQWTAKTYAVTFNANGGSCDTASKTVTYASTYGTLPTPTRSGYIFNGWYTASSGGTKVTSSSTVSITANQTLYAQWTEIVLTSIALKTSPSVTKYYVGDTLDTTGLTLIAIYSDGSTKIISSGFTCTPTTFSAAGTKAITVSYGGKTAGFSVTVEDVVLSSIAVKTMPANTTYYVGDSLDTTGLTLTAAYNNGTTKTVSSGFTCTPTTLSTAGTQKITVTYGSKTTSFNVTVEDVALSSVAVKSNPTKTNYYVGDTIDTSGLTLTATYNNGTTKTISSGFECTPTKFSTAGTQKVTVTYGGKTANFNVTVTAVTVSSISIKTTPSKMSCFVGDTLDTTGLTLTATYNNGTTKTISSGFTCNPEALNTAGSQEITVTYSGKTTTFDVNVESIALSSIAVKTNPTKTSYYVGDVLNTSGLTLTATYNNGSTKTISSGFTCTPTTLDTAGTQKITVIYGEKTAEFKINVTAVSVSSVAVKTMPLNTEYFVGDTLSTEGLILTVIYNNGKTDTVSSGFACTPTKLNTAGTQKVTVTYSGKTTSFNVAVNEVVISGISIASVPETLSYYVGDTLSTDGLAILVTYNNGTTKTVTSGFTCTPTVLETEGTQKITVTYGGKTASFNVSVASVKVTELEIVTVPEKTSYKVGDKFDPTGLTMNAVNSKGEEIVVTDGFVCTPEILDKAGTQVVTVSYGGKSVMITVIVAEAEPKTYTVQFISDGEIVFETAYEEGEKVVKPSNPAKDGYKFMGWTPAVPDTMPAYDMTFTAVFEKSYICPDCGDEIIGEDAINAHIAAENAAKIKTTVKIKNNPGTKTIKYGETLRLTAITTDMPANAKIYWYVDGVKKGEGDTFNVSPSSESVEITVKVVDSNGNVLVNTNGNEVSDSQKVSVNSSFWQKIVSFFKNLFGMNRTVVQSIFKGTF